MIFKILLCVFVTFPFISFAKKLFEFKPIEATWLAKYPPIKKEVEAILKKRKKNITKSAKELFKEFPTTALLPYKLSVQELMLFKHTQNDVISVRMAIRSYTGGAHGNYFYHSWNWDKKKKKLISLDEVVSPARFKQIVKEVRAALIKQQTKKYKYNQQMQAEIEKGTDDKKDFSIWNLKKDGIEFTFPEHQVSTFSEGNFKVFISL